MSERIIWFAAQNQSLNSWRGYEQSEDRHSEGTAGVISEDRCCQSTLFLCHTFLGRPSDSCDSCSRPETRLPSRPVLGRQRWVELVSICDPLFTWEGIGFYSFTSFFSLSLESWVARKPNVSLNRIREEALNLVLFEIVWSHSSSVSVEQSLSIFWHDIFVKALRWIINFIMLILFDIVSLYSFNSNIFYTRMYCRKCIGIFFLTLWSSFEAKSGSTICMTDKDLCLIFHGMLYKPLN